MKYKSIKIFICLIAIFSISNMTTYANDVCEPTEYITEYEEEPTKGEVTEYKYKYIGDILYKRLWSVTRHCWIDPIWYVA